MKGKLLFIAAGILFFSVKSFGQVADFACPSVAAQVQSPSQTAGQQSLVLLFVDFPDGRIQPGNTIPVQDLDTANVANIDAVGGMGYTWVDQNHHELGLRKMIRKYTYDDYWDMFFSQGTYYGSVHPDYDVHQVQVYGSFKEYYSEVSYGNLTIMPYQTKPGGTDKYHTGIINAIDQANGKNYVRWMMMAENKTSSTYSYGPYKILPSDFSTIHTMLVNAFNSGEINFNIDSYSGRIMIVAAGGWDGGMDASSCMTVREKRGGHNTDNTSVLDGILMAVHEFGHSLGFDHLASGTYDPMNPTEHSVWTKYPYCPEHFNPLYKLKAGWISASNFVKLHDNGTINLPSSNSNPTFGTVTVYGDALRNGDQSHSEYFVLEYRTRQGFNSFAGGENATSFLGGVLVWHYSKYSTFTFDQGVFTSQTNNLGLKVANYVDNTSNNHTSFVGDNGDPSHFFYNNSYGNHSQINQGSNPNANSLEQLTTGISLSNFTVTNNQIAVNVNYASGAVPTYSQFFTGGTIPSTISGNVFIGGGSFPSGLTVNDQSHVDCVLGQGINTNYLSANASSQNSISFRGAGFGNSRLPWQGIILQDNGSQRSSITKCLITDAAYSGGPSGTFGVRINIMDDGLEPTISSNQFQNCAADLYLDNYGTATKEMGGYDNNSLARMEMAGNWRLSASSFTVSNGSTMTVDPGSILKFLSSSSLAVNGTLNANGTSLQPVTFMGTSGSWSGIFMGYLSTANLSWCNVNNAPVSICGGSLTLNGTYTIGSNLTLSLGDDAAVTVNGTLNINNTLTISDNRTILALNPGATLRFGNGVSLVTNGVLNANGTSSQPITFTSGGAWAWGSIVLNGAGASGSTIQYANLQNGNEIDVLSGASNVTIKNCNITNNSGYGINVYFSSGFLAQQDTIANSNVYNGILITAGSNNNCYQNVIYKTDHNRNGGGILYSGSSGHIAQNDVEYYGWGIAAIWGASPDAYWSYSAARNNRATNCFYGLEVYYQSYMNFGVPPPSDYMWNSIYGDCCSADVCGPYPTVPCALWAYGDWWGDSPRFFGGDAGDIFWDGGISSDPWSGIPLPSGSQSIAQSGVKTAYAASRASNTGAEIQSSSGPKDSQDSILIGMRLIGQDKRREAKDYFLSFIKKHPDNQAAYVELYSCADSETTPAIIDFFKSLPSQAAKDHKLLLANLYLNEGEADLARQVNGQIISDNPGTALAAKAKLNNFYIALYNDNDPKSASSILKEVRLDGSLFSQAPGARQSGSSATPIEISDAEHALQLYVDLKTERTANGNMEQKGGESASNVSGQNAIVENYPNPFNPTTRISYQLAMGGHVMLRVYDILGREVATLVNTEQQVGFHQATFDGSRLASGVYFYRLTAPGIIQVKKMLMTK